MHLGTPFAIYSVNDPRRLSGQPNLEVKKGGFNSDCMLRCESVCKQGGATGGWRRTFGPGITVVRRVQRCGSREQTLSVLVLLVNYLDARLRPEERVCKWNKHSKFEIRLSLHSSAASASGQSTAVTAPLLFRWAARRFSNNGELQKK